MTEQENPDALEFELVVEDDNDTPAPTPPATPPTNPAPQTAPQLDLAGIERGHRMQAVMKALLPEGIDMEEEMKHVNLKVKPDGTLDGDVYYRPPANATQAPPEHPLAGNVKGQAIIQQRFAQASDVPEEDYARIKDSIIEQKRALGLYYDG